VKADRSQPASIATAPPEVTGGLTWWRRLRARQSAISTAIPLVLIWIGLSFASPYFLTVDNISNIFLQASALGLIAGGMTIALIAAEIDLSVGSVVALTGSLVALLMVKYGVPWPLAVLLALIVGAD
jgi:ribose/xylose/arabinose/galactoside ABC-type transport system permease subunit